MAGLSLNVLVAEAPVAAVDVQAVEAVARAAREEPAAAPEAAEEPAGLAVPAEQEVQGAGEALVARAGPGEPAAGAAREVQAEEPPDELVVEIRISTTRTPFSLSREPSFRNFRHRQPRISRSWRP